MSVRIQIESISFGYPRAPLLFDGMSASVIATTPVPGRGYVTVVMGASGSGKTTLLKLILREETVSRGSITVEPPDLRVSYLSQDPILFEHLSVADNARYFSKLRSTRKHFSEEVYLRASQELQLSSILQTSSSVIELSGGERQRVALLRALSIRPSLLLLDEPCRGLDIPVRQEFLFYLRRLADEFGLAVIYVTHQHAEARLLADWILFLIRSNSSGTAKVVEGTLGDFISAPAHESIALTFFEGPVNRFPAELIGNKLLLFNRTYVFEPCSDNTKVTNSAGSVLFGASQVKWNTNGGIPCRKTIGTGQFVIASINDHTSTASVVIGPHPEAEVNTFDVNGRVFLFRKDGTLLTTGIVMGLFDLAGS